MARPMIGVWPFRFQLQQSNSDSDSDYSMVSLERNRFQFHCSQKQNQFRNRNRVPWNQAQICMEYIYICAYNLPLIDLSLAIQARPKPVVTYKFTPGPAHSPARPVAHGLARPMENTVLHPYPHGGFAPECGTIQTRTAYLPSHGPSRLILSGDVQTSTGLARAAGYGDAGHQLSIH